MAKINFIEPIAEMSYKELMIKKRVEKIKLEDPKETVSLEIPDYSPIKPEDNLINYK